MSDNQRPSVARGFLFADLRGYSAFVERHGDRAAADLLVRYRDLVRSAVDRFDGAEIKTEGDSFYVAFASASSAIRCGLGILDRASQPAAAETGPIEVGIGIHVGETVELDEGYVGSAVNIAARVCAQAMAGELLVTDAVRAVTRTAMDVVFEPAGRRRLKGISEPIALHRVHPAGTTFTRGRLRAGPIVALLAVLAGASAVGLIGASLLAGGADPAGGLAGSEPPAMSATVEAPQSARPSATAEDAEFPTAAEASNLELINAQLRDECHRADPADGPRFRDPAGRTQQELRDGNIPWVQLNVSGGIECAFVSGELPDSIWIWTLDEGYQYAGNPEEWIVSYAAQVGAVPGSCSVDRASILETWNFSGRNGMRLCVVASNGDAIVYWTYAGSDIIAKAIREHRAIRDGSEMEVLLAWWQTHAPLARD